MNRNRAKVVGSVANLEQMELQRLKSRVERLVAALEEAIDAEGGNFESFLPPLDIRENDECIVVQAEIPGVEADDIDLSISAKEVLIEGRKKHSSSTEKATSHFCCERQYGSFYRRIVLRWAININDVAAELKDGLLTVKLPKLVDRRGKPVKIAIKSE